MAKAKKEESTKGTDLNGREPLEAGGKRIRIKPGCCMFLGRGNGASHAGYLIPDILYTCRNLQCTPCSKCYGMYAGLQGHLGGGLKGEFLDGRLPGTFRRGFREGIPRTFSGGLRGDTLRRGFKVPSESLQGGTLRSP